MMRTAVDSERNNYLIFPVDLVSHDVPDTSSRSTVEKRVSLQADIQSGKVRVRISQKLARRPRRDDWMCVVPRKYDHAVSSSFEA